MNLDSWLPFSLMRNERWNMRGHRVDRRLNYCAANTSNNGAREGVSGLFGSVSPGSPHSDGGRPFLHLIGRLLVARGNRTLAAPILFRFLPLHPIEHADQRRPQAQ